MAAGITIQVHEDEDDDSAMVFYRAGINDFATEHEALEFVAWLLSQHPGTQVKVEVRQD